MRKLPIILFLRQGIVDCFHYFLILQQYTYHLFLITFKNKQKLTCLLIDTVVAIIV